MSKLSAKMTEVLAEIAADGNHLPTNGRTSTYGALLTRGLIESKVLGRYTATASGLEWLTANRPTVRIHASHNPFSVGDTVQHATHPSGTMTVTEVKGYMVYTDNGNGGYPTAFAKVAEADEQPTTPIEPVACCSLYRAGVDCGCADAAADRLTGFEPEDDEFTTCEHNEYPDDCRSCLTLVERPPLVAGGKAEIVEPASFNLGRVPLGIVRGRVYRIDGEGENTSVSFVAFADGSVYVGTPDDFHALPEDADELPTPVVEPVRFRPHELLRIPTGERFVVLGTVGPEAVDYPTIPGTPGVYLQGNDGRPTAVFEPALSTCFTAVRARVAYVADAKSGLFYTVDGPVYDEFGNGRMHLTGVTTLDVRTPKLGNFSRRFVAVCGQGCRAPECGHRFRWNEPASYVADDERARAEANAEQLRRVVVDSVRQALAPLLDTARRSAQAFVTTRRGRRIDVDPTTGERSYLGIRIPPRADFVPRADGRTFREQGPCPFGSACEVHGDPAEREREAFWQELWTLAGGEGSLTPWQLHMLRTLDDGPFPTLKPRVRDFPSYGFTL